MLCKDRKLQYRILQGGENMKCLKKIRVKLLAVALVLMCCVSMTCLAASYSFKYEMYQRVIGSTNYSLSAANTSVTANGNTYRADTEEVRTSKLNYHVNLHKRNTIGSYTAWKTANGKNVTWNLGDKSKGTYNIDIETNQESGLISAVVKGSGTIKQ